MKQFYGTFAAVMRFVLFCFFFVFFACSKITGNVVSFRKILRISVKDEFILTWHFMNSDKQSPFFMRFLIINYSKE